MLAMFAATAAAAAAPPLIPENHFALAYNEWIRLRAEAPAGTRSAPAIRQWKLVERAWKKLAKAVQ